ncbi:uncharacterized protein LOC127746487 [Arachis duranensis]|uniref:Uncharacterized protein LOC127746487 n=1 Tax=Arachis duranensis TaxID=130453 RepID=A0A9C6TKT4_ARADU|nr:uncharacterized protein LOC127746487 [Arachis duranensis]
MFPLNCSLPSLSIENVTSFAVAATAATRVARAPFVAIVVRPLSAVLLSYELFTRRSRRCFFSPRRNLFSSPLVQGRRKSGEENKVVGEGEKKKEESLGATAVVGDGEEEKNKKKKKKKSKKQGLVSRIWNGIFRRCSDDFEKRL